jgi:hypothetical protein
MLGGRKMRDKLTDRLSGFTQLRELNLSVDPQDGSCTLCFVLSKLDSNDSSDISVACSDVQRLNLSAVGSTPQLMFLKVEDISSQQLDRVNYSVEEIEHETISFVCRSVELSD